MEHGWIIWRIIFWAGILIILALGTVESFLKRRVSIRKWIVILISFAFLCFFFCNAGLITYGQRWWVHGQIVDRETKQPIKKALVVSSCYKPDDWNQRILDDRFMNLKKLIASDDKTSTSPIYGVTDQRGHFVCNVSYMSGDIPFGFPFWGSLGKKYAWLLIRKEGYPSAVFMLETRGWREAKRLDGEQVADTTNDIGTLYLSSDRKEVPQ